MLSEFEHEHNFVDIYDMTTGSWRLFYNCLLEDFLFRQGSISTLAKKRKSFKQSSAACGHDLLLPVLR